MARATFAAPRKARKNKLFKRSKGFHLARKNTLRQANQAVMKAQAYAYRGRKERKRQFRRLWIVRINAALMVHELSYSKFIHGLKLAQVELDRKILSDLAITDPAAFSAVVDRAKKALAG
jgi:large subunit ribosomal protein L20